MSPLWLTILVETTAIAAALLFANRLLCRNDKLYRDFMRIRDAWAVSEATLGNAAAAYETLLKQYQQLDNDNSELRGSLEDAEQAAQHWKTHCEMAGISTAETPPEPAVEYVVEYVDVVSGMPDGWPTRFAKDVHDQLERERYKGCPRSEVVSVEKKES